jgi:ADP-ribose pyrophosphatase YjhB (NUDIX family)
MKMKHCPECGYRLIQKEIESINRAFCECCQAIRYRNPTVGVAVIVLKKEHILLVKRIGTYANQWCIPCGHVEWGEDIREAARRELLEETGLAADVGPVFDALSNFHDKAHLTVGLWFWANSVKGRLIPGSDASEVAYFPLDQLPAHMAFPTDIIICKQLKYLIASGKLTRWFQKADVSVPEDV